MSYLIKTSSGFGSPGYLESKAPEGLQWQDLKGNHLKVPEGTKVEKTSQNTPNGFCEITIASGPFSGMIVWVKASHLLEVKEGPIVPPFIEEEFKLRLTNISVKFNPFVVEVDVKKLPK